MRIEPQTSKSGKCQLGKRVVGELHYNTLCFDSNARTLDFIRYNIATFGAELDLDITDKLAAELAAASKKSIGQDRDNPNFIVLWIANDTDVNLEKELVFIGFRDASDGARRLERNVHDYQQGIIDKTITFGSQPLTMTKKDGQLVYVVVVVQKVPSQAVFIASNIVDSMMNALGLSLGVY